MDAYSLSSTMYPVPQGRSVLPVKVEMNEEGDKKCKQLKLMTPVQECVYHSVLEDLSPLGLTLRKTPSFLDLVETRLSHSKPSCSGLRKRKSIDADNSTQQINAKTKASSFPVANLRIGSWERVSRYDGDLVAKCYFAKRRFLWEVLDGRLKNKIEVPWSDIASIKATFKDNSPEELEIELLRRPLFFRETNPQPRKHTLWKATEDFTGGQASLFRRHKLQFPQGTLQKHYEKLLQLDSGLSFLSKKPYPSLNSPFFDPDDVESHNLDGHKIFGLEGESSNLIKQMLWGTSDAYSGQLHHFTLTTYSIPDHIVASSETSSTNSGASSSYLSNGTPNSTSEVLPSLFVSVSPDISESYHRNKAGVVENISYVSGDTLDAPDAYSSTPESKPHSWSSEIHSVDPKAVVSLDPVIHEDELDQCVSFSGFSYFAELDCNLHGEMSSDWTEIFANISDSADFPLLILEDQEASHEVVDWTSWL